VALDGLDSNRGVAKSVRPGPNSQNQILLQAIKDNDFRFFIVRNYSNRLLTDIRVD
jgi:hypothetical protein